jgi:hypothetical protein
LAFGTLVLDPQVSPRPASEPDREGGAGTPGGDLERIQPPARCRELATWIADEYRALRGGHQRKVELDDRGMFPGTLAP